jgi:hypothetical protein
MNAQRRLTGNFVTFYQTSIRQIVSKMLTSDRTAPMKTAQEFSNECLPIGEDVFPNRIVKTVSCAVLEAAGANSVFRS